MLSLRKKKTAMKIVTSKKFLITLVSRVVAILYARGLMREITCNNHKLGAALGFTNKSANRNATVISLSSDVIKVSFKWDGAHFALF